MQFVGVSEVRLVVLSFEVCASGGSATTIGLGFGPGNVILPSSVFFPSLSATFGRTEPGR
jgi:hypothetical protein